MEFGIRDLLYIVGIVVSTLITFFGTRHGLTEYIRDKHDGLKDQIHDLKINLREHKAKDDLQQQVLDQIGKQMDELIPKLISQLEDKKTRK